MSDLNSRPLKTTNEYIVYCNLEDVGRRGDLDRTLFEMEKGDWTVILAPVVFGAIDSFHVMKGMRGSNYSSGFFYALWDGKDEVLPGTAFPEIWEWTVPRVLGEGC